MNIPEVVLATRNRDKIREIREILKDFPLTVKTLDDYPEFPAPEENEPTLEGNALLKARAVTAFTGQAAVADDTGLEVDALNGKPGVHSARYAGPHASYIKNLEKLLLEMRKVPDVNRGARFRCVIALCLPDKKEKTVQGVVEGKIIHAPRGSDGFGYDPVFVPDGYDQTFSEIPLAEKNKISHRGKALQQLKKILSGM